MAIVWDKVRSRRRRRAGAQAPASRASIREVCLVGVHAPGAVAARGATWENAWAAGGVVTWSGRTYQVEAAQAGAADEPFRYVHLSAVAED
jgi:hypothetical protein